MARNLEHFELPKWKQTFPRRRRGGGGSPKRDKQAHGSQLILQADQVANDLQRRTQDAPQGINPKLIFKLELHSEGNLDENQLRQLGLRLLARDPDRATVVFPDEELHFANCVAILVSMQDWFLGAIAIPTWPR
jgi:hypothetical protein